MIYKKAFGQHFLNNEITCKEIVELLFSTDAIDSVGNVNLLEIGPGAGAITKYLVKYPWKKYLAVEIDQHKIDYLTKENVLKIDQIIPKDFLTIDMPFQESFKVIGNFPYNISTQIMFKIFDWYNYVPEVVGMFQKEVAVRICSKEGNKDYGILSILTQALYDSSVEINVPPSDFTPPPKVDSAVILLKSNNNKYQIKNFRKFTSFIKLSFSMRRKTLRNNLKSYFSADILASDFFNKRPEQVSVVEFIDLYKSYAKDE